MPPLFLCLSNLSRSHLMRKRKKIVKCGERLFPHSYSSGVAQQRDWLTTLPYVLPDTLPFLFVSHCSYRFQTLAFTFLSLARIQVRAVVYMYICATVLLLSAHTSPFVSSRYKFIPLTFSPSLSRSSPLFPSFSLSRLSFSLFIFSQRLFWVTHRFASNSPLG